MSVWGGWSILMDKKGKSLQKKMADERGLLLARRGLELIKGEREGYKIEQSIKSETIGRRGLFLV